MLDLEENKRKITELNNRLNDIYISLNLEKQKNILKELEDKTCEDGFWNDSVSSNNILKQIKNIKNKLKMYNDISNLISDIFDSNELLKIDNDEELEKELEKLTCKAENELQNFEIQALLSDKYDNNNAIITLHPGAGGTESQDWAQMLYRMYARWANKNNYTLKELDYLEGEEAGIKSVTALIEGENAYGYLKSEQGVHRLVRISPFDAGRKKAYFFCFS